MKKSNVVLFSHIYPAGQLESLKAASGGRLNEVANDNYEKSFIKLFERVFSRFFLINQPFTSSKRFFSKKLFVRSVDFTYSKTSGKSVAFYANSYFQLLFKNHLLKKSIVDYEKINGSIDIAILSTYHNAGIINFLKRRNKNCFIILLLPDLPIFHYKKLSLFGKILFKPTLDSFAKGVKNVSFLIPITATMVDYLGYCGKRSFVIEGIVETSKFGKITQDDEKINRREIGYLGNLKEAYGVKNLVDAVLSSNVSGIALALAGRGDMEAELEQLSEKSSKVKYYGFLSKEETIKLERRLSLLVVPERGLGDYAKYSFHSKIFEYMLSGTPVLLYDYPGIPRTYIQHLFLIVDTNNPTEDLKNSIENFFNQNTDLVLFKAQAAQKFLLENNNSRTLALKLQKKLQEFIGVNFESSYLDGLWNYEN